MGFSDYFILNSDVFSQVIIESCLSWKFWSGVNTKPTYQVSSFCHDLHKDKPNWSHYYFWMRLFVKLEEIPTCLSNITYSTTLIILKYYTERCIEKTTTTKQNKKEILNSRKTKGIFKLKEQKTSKVDIFFLAV